MARIGNIAIQPERKIFYHVSNTTEVYIIDSMALENHNHVVIGYSEERNEIWENNKNGFIHDWHERRQDKQVL